MPDPNENPNTPPGVSQEEADRKAAEAADQARSEVQSEIEGLKADIATKTAEMEKLQQTDRNWQALREQKEQLEQKLNTAIQEIDTKVTAAVQKQRLTDLKDSEIAKMAGDDVELAKKLKIAFDTRTAGDTSTEEGIRTRVRDAYLLVAEKPAGVMTSAAMGSPGTVVPQAPNTDVKPEVIQMAKENFGIPEDKVRKHLKQYEERTSPNKHTM